MLLVARQMLTKRLKERGPMVLLRYSEIERVEEQTEMIQVPLLPKCRITGRFCWKSFTHTFWSI